EQLMEQYVRINTAKSYVEGWRVQVISTTDRQRLESVRQSLKARYPYLSTSWVHNRPYYRLRAGAFATKLEALQLQHLLREYYPGSIPTRDTEITASEIIGL
ncbi:MAG: SPOR domain-containing protein, partial [Bacteroidota bacterium]